MERRQQQHKKQPRSRGNGQGEHGEDYNGEFGNMQSSREEVFSSNETNMMGSERNASGAKSRETATKNKTNFLPLHVQTANLNNSEPQFENGNSTPPLSAVADARGEKNNHQLGARVFHHQGADNGTMAHVMTAGRPLSNKLKLKPIAELAGGKENNGLLKVENEPVGNPLLVTLTPEVKLAIRSSAADASWFHCEQPGCDFYTRKRERIERHRLSHLPGSKAYVCPEHPKCSFKFHSLAKLLKHDRKAHTGVKDYECRICDTETTDLVSHMKVSSFQFLGMKLDTLFSFLFLPFFPDAQRAKGL